ncbi:MAG: cation diffusion facilitator family transporter [Gemmatimonadota bacterium]|nr:cation diffusion facilitator family transporter [Gemmatimonadota bacterium]MDH4347167.1 cation diffusion facilitator family transporter [Gemmatimonadota bacterium]
MPSAARKGIRSAQAGLLINAALVVVKLVAGVVGNAYALVADAIESAADIFSSLVVWGGLRIASREADDEYPFGYGKAEALATAVVALMLLGAAAGIAVEATREIRTPHHTPAPFTLFVLVGVILVKEVLFRRVLAVGEATASTAVQADAWHHRSDAITSAAAFVGIAVALLGGEGWEQADDWAALVAASVIVFNGTRLLRVAIADLMDRSPGAGLLERIAAATAATPEVRDFHKLKVRKVGLGYYVDLHVQAHPLMSLRDAHVLSGKVKTAIRSQVPEVAGVIIHMEPDES